MDSKYFSHIVICALSLLAIGSQPLAAVRGTQLVVTNKVEPSLATQEERLYIVQLDEPPAVVVAASRQQRARVAGSIIDALPDAIRTRRFDPNNTDVRRHVNRLQEQQDALLDALNAQQNKIYSYRYTFNGLALKLTPRQAENLRTRKGVARVWEDRKRRVATSDSPSFLGLTNSTGGLHSDLGLKGEDVIIGIIDSGIAPGHPSFSERAFEADKPNICKSEWAENSLLGLWLCARFDDEGPIIFTNIPEYWRGTCEAGEGFKASDCNNKLIGARFYNEGFLLGGPIDDNEFSSPADADGHGTHIASIAAGNVVDADIFGHDIGEISGMAPRARVAIYKACWLEPGAFRATCSNADLQAAIEDAVADGVDIINYSIGELDDSLTDPDDLALLAAADAGVLSVVATGNSGPEQVTIMAPATNPWVLSAGASSRAGTRVAEALRVNTPESVAKDYESKEASFTPTLSSLGSITANLILIDDDQVITPDEEIGTVLDGCSGLANGDEVNGNIAYIQRGGCDFDLKVAYARDAGAVAVVVFNNDDNLIVMVGDGSGISIPAVMIGQADGQLLRDKLALDESIEITLDKSLFIDLSDSGNVMGTFSGRGPSLADSDFLKPDLIAPGVQILGGHTQDVANGFRGEEFQYLSGTSQSTPHIAGVAALIKEAKPDWSPAAIKSALMTTARQDILKEAAGENADPFDMGAGHIVPNSAVAPGLVYETLTEEYDSYLCTIGLARISQQACESLVALGYELDARDINLPSVAVTELVSSVEITRRVRNVGPAAVFNAEIDTPAGIELDISPQSLTLGPDDVAEFTLRFTRDGAALSEWLFGSYTWVSESHEVRSPFAVNSAALSTTQEITATGATGVAPLTVNFGYDGDYRARPFGLSLPCVLPDNDLDDDGCNNITPAAVGNDPFNSYVFTDPEEFWVTRFFVDLTPTAENPTLNDVDFYFRAALYDAATDGIDDLDLYVYFCVDNEGLPNGEPDGVCEQLDNIGISQRDGSSNELVEDFAARPGVYIIDVHGYETDPTDGDAIAQFCLYTWSFNQKDNAMNLIIDGAPNQASSGSSSDITASWSNLEDGLWIGGVAHTEPVPTGDPDNENLLDYSLLEVNVNALPDHTGAEPFICP